MIKNVIVSCGARLYVAASNIMTGNFLATKVDETFISNAFKDQGAADSDGALSGISSTVDSWGKGGVTVTKQVAVYGALIFLIIFGIGYAMHAKDVQEHSNDKKALPGIVIGILITFGAGALLTVMYKVFNTTAS